MKRALQLLLVFLLGFEIAAAQQVIYVKEGATGNGTSWADATGDLVRALQSAQNEDEIWIAKGKYVPTKSNDRHASFVIPNGVLIYGGFAGHEQAIEERDIEYNRTILSGEIGSPSIQDNSYSVIYTHNVTPSTLIDGIVIASGASNGLGTEGEIETCGAGWFNDGSNGASSPTIRNCIFINNYARIGAALYNYAENGSCKPRIQNCLFKSNMADLDGGAIYNDGNHGECSPKIEKCTFADNKATYGAGILNRGNHGETRPVITKCVFVGNTSIIKGGGIYNDRQEGGTCIPVISACRFEKNISMAGLESLESQLTESTPTESGFNLKNSGY